MFIETCIAPVNIALIKYWGKRDEERILPINDSLSMTLNMDELCTKTTIAASDSFKENKMWLNGELVPFDDNPRIARCLNELKRLALAKCFQKFPLDWKLHIATHNNFPTAAGLASSAAGYACLIYTLACLYNIEDEDISAIARQGSGSACRSLYGGFVQWHMGTLNDGSDSIAKLINTADHWPEMHVLILVVNDGRKKTSSTKGMQCSVQTSELIMHRAKEVVPKRINAIKEAIAQRDFATFAKITMKDSNQFHAVALDTYPPCVYLNDISHAIINFVHEYNNAVGAIKVCYTFDAGPNGCLYLLERDVAQVLMALQWAFPNDADNNVEYLKGIPIECCQENATLNGNATKLSQHDKNLLKYIIHTKIGNGPQRLDEKESLLNLNDGAPIEI